MSDVRAEGLLRLLAVHRPVDGEEAGHRDQIVALVETSSQPFDRNRFSPGHVTASGFVVDAAAGRILLVHHRRLGIWIQPGGHVDSTDAGAEAAARREIAEETGLAGLAPASRLLDVDVHEYPARPGGDPAHRHFDVRFAYPAVAGFVEPNDEVHQARWVGRAELEGLGVDRSILRPASKLLD